MNRLTRLLPVILLFASVSAIRAQSLTVNTTGALADTSAMLDVATTAKGVLIPRMTAAQRAAIFLPATGLLVYQTDGSAGFYYNSGTGLSPVWALMLSGNGGTIAGTLSTAAQPNITSIGTLANLTVTGTVTAGSVKTGSLTATGNVSVQGNLAVAGSLALSSLSLSGGLTTTGDAALLGNLALSGIVTGLRLNIRHASNTEDFGAILLKDTDDVIIIEGLHPTIDLPVASAANKGKVMHIIGGSGQSFSISLNTGILYPFYFLSQDGVQTLGVVFDSSDTRTRCMIVSDGQKWIEITGDVNPYLGN